MKIQIQIIWSILVAIAIVGLLYFGNYTMEKRWKDDQERREVIRVVQVVDETLEDKEHRDNLTVKIESDVADGRDRYITQIKEIEKYEKENVPNKPTINDPIPARMSDALRERRLARDRAISAGKQPQ